LNEALVIDGYEEHYLGGGNGDNDVDSSSLYGIRMMWVCNGFACFPASYQENER
jgi:hypothetical protein